MRGKPIQIPAGSIVMYVYNFGVCKNSKWYTKRPNYDALDRID